MSEIIYRGKILNLRVDTVELEPGKTARFEVVEHGDSIGVLPVTDAGTALLVRQYRHAIGETLLEIVAGNVDPGEEFEQAALRELSEEVGHSAREIVPLGGVYLCPGYTTEFMHLFLARGLYPESGTPDDDEQIDVAEIGLDELYRQARAGELRDSKSVAALLMAEELLRNG